jgi:phage tail sheath protein FI
MTQKQRIAALKRKVEREIRKACKHFIFEPVNKNTIKDMTTTVRAMLEKYIPYDYVVVCDETNNTIKNIRDGIVKVGILAPEEKKVATTRCKTKRRKKK